VLAPWLFVILIATSTFTASLTSMMTVSQLEPSVLDIKSLLKRNSPVGCNGNSFIVKYLTEVQKFKPENIRRINSINDYPSAFQNKDIEAAFFIAPHAKVFMAKYSCRGFIKAGNTFRLGGLGFVGLAPLIDTILHMYGSCENWGNCTEKLKLETQSMFSYIKFHYFKTDYVHLSNFHLYQT